MRISAVTPHLRRLLLGSTALTGLALALASTADAGGLPTGGTVAVGTATIAQTAANKLAVTTGGARTVIDWQSFSIANGNKVTIQQPGKSSITVNEVTGGTPSQIFGDLWSNGQVVLANPNGIWFGPNSHVDVAGLVASTATMTAQAKQAFAAGGRLALDGPGSATASIVNDGHITIAGAGLGALVAPGVRNNGVIAATLGQVTLAAGTTSTLDFYGDGLVSLAVTSPVTAVAIGPDGKPFKAAIENNGTLAATGGHVLVTADVVKGLVDNVINMSGVVEAKGATQTAAGDIVLDGGDGGVMVAGTLDASAAGAGRTGGSVAVAGGTVTLASTAKIDASGAAGGGTVQVGGGPHGGGTLKHAQATTVAAGASIKADATRNGTGGTVSIWSDQATIFNGSISAKGAGTGNGGWVETSSEGQLGVGLGAQVNTLAPGGTAGTWLLDPINITIQTGGTDPIGSTNSFITIDPSTIDSAASNVVLDATSNLTVLPNSSISMTNPVSLTLIGESQVRIQSSISLLGRLDIRTGINGTVAQDAGTTISTPSAVEIYEDGSNALSLPTTFGATITLGGTISANGIYVKAADQAFAQAGFIDVLSTAQLVNNETGAATDGTHADLVLYAGVGTVPGQPTGIHLEQCGSTCLSINAASGNIAFVADNLVIGDAVANVSTPNAVIVSPGSTRGSLSGGTNYTDFTNGGFTSAAILTGTVPGGGAEATVGVTGGTGTYQIPQSTLDALSGTFPGDGLVHIGQLQVGLPSTTAGVNVAGASFPISTALYGGTVDLTGTTNVAGDLFVSPLTATDLGGSVTATGSQSFVNPILVTSTASLTTTGAFDAGDITFDSTSSINSSGGTSGVTIAAFGAVSFAGLIGNTTALSSLDVTGSSIALPTQVATGGSQGYHGPVTFAGTGTNTLTSGGAIAFDSSINGSGALSVSATGGITLGSVTTAGSQTYTGTVTLPGDSTFDSGGNTVTFNNPVNGSASLTVNNSTTALGGSVSTSGPQIYGNITLLSDVVLTASGGLQLGSVESPTTAHGLTIVDNPFGDAVSIGPVGQGSALSQLVVTGTNITLGSVHTTNGQDYAGAVTVTGSPTFLSDSSTITFEQQIFGTGSGLTVNAASGIVLGSTITTSGAQVYNGPVRLSADTTVNSTGGSIQFAGTIDGTTPGAQSLTVQTATSANFGGAIGGTTSLNQFFLTAGTLGTGGVSGVNANLQGYDITSGLNLTGTLTFAGFEDSGPINLMGDTTLNAGAGGITISGSVDGAHALVLNGTGSRVSLTGPVGQATPLASLALTGGSGISLGSALTTTGAQTFNSAVTLISATTLNASSVGFGGSVTDTAGNPLTVSASGGITFGGSVSTVGDQTYNDPVAIAGDLTIQSTGGSVIFNNTIDGAHALTLGAANAVELDGAIGGGTALTSFATSGNTVLNGPVSIATTGGGITFGGQLNNLVARSGSLTLNGGGGNIAFNGLVGNVAPLGNVTIGNAANVTGPALNATSLANGVNEFRARSLTVGSTGSPITGNFTMPGGISIVPGDDQSTATTTGAIFIDAAGSVTIGTNNGGNPSNDLGVFARGADISSSPTAIAGNGGTITITGSSLTLTDVSVRGGETRSGSAVTAAGGNAGTINLTATGGGITIVGGVNDAGIVANGGWSTNGGAGGAGGTITINAPGAFAGSAAPSFAAVTADGGGATGGAGGNAGAITINAATIASSRIRARGGDTASATAAGGAGGTITLIATGTGADVVLLTGNASDFSGSATAITYGTLNVRGGEQGVADAVTTDIARGTIAGAGGSIVIEGTSSGGALQGAVALVNGGSGAGPTPTTSFQGGPDILITAAGTSGHGGTVSILGSIEAADNGAENLSLGGANATLSIGGDIGSAANRIGSLVLTGNGSTISVGGSVTTNAVVEQRTTGGFTVAGALSTLSYTSPITNTVSLDLSSLFSASDHVSLAGSYLLTGGGNFSADALTLSGTTVISTPGGASPLTIGSIDGAFGLTLNGGTGSVAFNAIGTHTALSSLTITAGAIGLGSVVTTGAQTYTGTLTTGGTYTANGFSTSGPLVMAANTTINGGAGDITLGGTVNGTFALALVSSNANVFFGGSVGTPSARVTSLSITGADNATVQNNSTLSVDRFTATNVSGTIDFGNHSLESDDIVAIQATTVEGRIVTTSSATIDAGTVSGTIQGSAVSVSASGAVNAAVTADSASITGSSFSGSVQATRSASIAATGDVSADVVVTSGGASLSGANVGGTVTSAGLAQIAASQTVAENVTAGGIGIRGTAAITGNYTSTGAPISIVGASLDGNVTGLNGGSVAITASQFIIGNIAGGDVALTAPFIEVNITATTAEINSNFAILSGTIGGIDAQQARFPTDITQVVDGSTRQVANNDTGNTNSTQESSSDEDDNRKKKKSGDPVYDFANQYIDDLISGKPAH